MEQKHQAELALISEMIHTARKEFNEKGTVFLMWGWMVTIAALAQYALIQMGSEHISLPWLLMPLAAIAHFIIMRKERNTERVKTHVGNIIGSLWLVVGISIGLVLVMSYFLEANTYPILLILYAIGTFVTGKAINMKPLVYGAIACWLLAAGGFFVPFKYQLLLLALAMIVAYIIPGYAMNARYKQRNG